MFVHASAHMHACACIYAHVCACIGVPVCMYMHERSSVCVHARTYMHMCTCKQEVDKSKLSPGQVQGGGSRGRQRQAGRKQIGQAAYSHSDATVWALVPKCATLLLEGDEVPDGDDCVLGDVEVEELNAGKGAEWAELAWCAGEVVGHKEPVCRGEPRDSQWGEGLGGGGVVQHPSQTRPTHPDSEYAPKPAAWRQEVLGLGCFSESPGLMSAVPSCISQPWHSPHHAWFSITSSPVPQAVGTHPLEPEEPLSPAGSGSDQLQTTSFNSLSFSVRTCYLHFSCNKGPFLTAPALPQQVVSHRDTDFPLLCLLRRLSTEFITNQSPTLEPQEEGVSSTLPAQPPSSPMVCGGGMVHICVHICTRGCCLHARPSGGMHTHTHGRVWLCTAPCLQDTSCKPMALTGVTSP